VVGGRVVVGRAVVGAVLTDVVVGSGSEGGGRMDSSGRPGPVHETAARPSTATTPTAARRTRRCYGRVVEGGRAGATPDRRP
jgi:hypothetical protein